MGDQTSSCHFHIPVTPNLLRAWASLNTMLFFPAARGRRRELKTLPVSVPGCPTSPSWRTYDPFATLRGGPDHFDVPGYPFKAYILTGNNSCGNPRCISALTRCRPASLKICKNLSSCLDDRARFSRSPSEAVCEGGGCVCKKLTWSRYCRGRRRRRRRWYSGSP